MHSIITGQMVKYVQGKQIKNFNHESFYEGERPLDFTVKFDNYDKVIGATIKESDSNTLALDNDYIITFGYDNGGIRYYHNSSQAKAMKKDKKYITGGFIFIFTFNDDSCLIIENNSWTGSFLVLPKSDFKPTEKLNPFDSKIFTLQAFHPYFQKNIAVIAVCGTQKGCLDVDRGVIHEALYRSKINPKTKASKLTDTEVESLYSAIKKITTDIQSAGGLKGAIDLLGNIGEYEYSINTKKVGKPCTVCGTNIEKGNAFGSSIFICPICQIEK